MKSIASFLVLGGVVLFPSLGFAYCRTTTCAQQKPPADCTQDTVVGFCQTAGKQLYWPRSCVSFSVQKDGSKQPGFEVSADQLEAIVRTSFDNWQGMQVGNEWVCPDDGRPPNLSVVTFPRVECNSATYNKDAPNQNVWLFRDDAWPHQGGGDRTIALTLVSFNPTTGEIYDVDVEINAFAQRFKVDYDGTVGTDLQSVVQHESGHFLGLAHANDGNATMWSNYNGSAEMRTLKADDMAGICAIFPPTDTPDLACDPTPRHGFSTKCRDKQSSGCSINRETRSFGAWTAGLLLGAATLLRLGRRSRRG